jgi:hypothetical protein
MDEKATLLQNAMMKIMEPIKETNPWLASKEFEQRMKDIVSDSYDAGKKEGYAISVIKQSKDN